MQPRRHNDYTKLSPSGRLRKQPRHEVGHDSYAMSRREGVDRSPRILRRSLSPRGNTEGSKRMFHGEAEERRDSRDYGWHLGGGRGGRVRSGSPPYIYEPKRPHFDEGVVHRKYYLEEMDYDEGKRNKLNQVYGYDHHGQSSRMSQDLNDSGNRSANFDKHRMMEQKSMLVDDRMRRGSYQVSPDSVPRSRYGETDRHLPLMSQCEDISRIENENFRHREPISSDKHQVRELHKERENPLFHSRDGSYTVMTSQPVDFVSTSEFNGFSGISSEFSRTKYIGSYREGMPLPAPADYCRSSGKLTEPMDPNEYRQRSVEDIRDHEYSKRLVLDYAEGSYSGKRNGHDNYIYTKSQGFRNDDMYPSDDFQDLTPPRHYENAQTNFETRESSRPIIHPSSEMIDHPEDYGTTRKSTAWDYHAIQKQVAAENVDTGRRLYVSQHDGEYLDSELTRVKFGQRDLREMESSDLSISEDYPASHRRSEYGFGRDAGPQFRLERLQDSPASTYDLEMQRLAAEGKRVKEDLDIYEQTDKFLPRKYLIEDGIKGYETSTRGTMSSNWSEPKEFKDPYDSSNEWLYEGRNPLHVSRNRRIDHSLYTNTKRKFGGGEHPGDFAYKDSSAHDSIPHAQRHPAKQYKPGVKYVKGQARSDSSNSYNVHQTDKRSGIHRQHNNLKYNDYHGEDAHPHDYDTSQDRMHLAESELPEDSEEFKQLVEEAFLSYSKQLNSNSAVRRRYKEQGKAGSLFCIVCGRSASKEFLDTRRLVTHAYMSHKHGLRAQHLGLHRAICVLMGWSSFVPADSITCVPEVLPDAEALAQKEDLMLWPPLIIIHNISMSNNNPEIQKVVPIEGVEAFLRGKGFVGGKIKVSLGKPADQSVMLVKFLGTFTGLGNAEKLHRYFAENKRGRADFEWMTSNNKGGNRSSEPGKKGEKLEEHLLYGYIGIADDFDRLDFNTKKWIVIKSKKEIQDLANAPVKTEDA